MDDARQERETATQAAAAVLEEVHANPETLLGRLAKALKTGSVTPDKVYAYYKNMYKNPYQELMRDFMAGRLFLAQKKGFQQWMMADPHGQRADEKRYDDIWHAAFMCGEKLPETIERFYMSRVEPAGFGLWGRRIIRSEIREMGQTEQNDIERAWRRQADDNGWDWSAA